MTQNHALDLAGGRRDILMVSGRRRRHLEGRQRTARRGPVVAVVDCCPMNLASILLPHPADAVALISRGRPTTYGELRSAAAGLAGGLADRTSTRLTYSH